MLTWKFWLLLAAMGQVAPCWAKSPAPETDRDRLFHTYGIEALDKTDVQSPFVLKHLVFLLDHAFSPAFMKSLGDFRYLFAYAGHDREVEMAAFHPEAKAISVGGTLAYPESAKHFPDVDLLATLAHEIGHAVALGKLTPMELRKVGAEFGGWAPVFAEPVPADFYAKPYLTRHPLFAEARDENEDWRSKGICSQLALKNVHEWFADSFAGAVLQKMGAEGWLGTGWKARLVHRPEHHRGYWTNYNFVPAGFSAWLAKSIKLR
jgi:hypothetical protein